MRNRQSGFTLLELMVTLVILGSLVALGLPALNSMTQSSLLRQASSQLARDFAMARSEAADLNARVTLCRRNSATSTNCRGAGRSVGWNDQGWVIFRDEDGNQVSDDGEFIRVTDKINSNVTISLNGVAGRRFNNAVRFFPDGTIRDSAGRLVDSSMDLCISGSGIPGRRLQFSRTGSVRIVRSPACPGS